MATRRGAHSAINPAWWTVIMLTAIAVLIYTTMSIFAGDFRRYVPVVLAAQRSGLVMEPGAKVSMRGVVVGRVADLQGGDPVRLNLQIWPAKIKYIPANVGAAIRASTVFGAKYVDLIYPEHPSAARLAAGTVINSRNVTSEVNTVFENLAALLHHIDPAKLNGVLTALAEALRGQGGRIGEATSGANTVLRALNARTTTLARDWHSLAGAANTYDHAAADIMAILDAASTTSTTITDNAHALDRLLLAVTGFSNVGIQLLGPSKNNLVTGINALEPTTSLLLRHKPALTCTLVGAKKALDPDSQGGYNLYHIFGGGDGRSAILDIALLLGDDSYRYPDNLPITGAKGGPGGTPSCGSLPDVSKNFPVRYLVTNTGWGTGNDLRPNPGIGFPGYANFFPTTRGRPEPPSVRYPGGPAPGPIPYPGAPPYAGSLYAPDGTALYPGLPAARPPGAPRQPGPTPGSEPFIVDHPMQQQPTPTPPLPQQAAPLP